MLIFQHFTVSLNLSYQAFQVYSLHIEYSKIIDILCSF